ncbi:MAG: conserved exported protein of unknown function [Promethearchaeota archaeon]|nr:MAG: conserved exported protein of unknown function [Candidatus Lokiarchaeota archaeon]
MRAARVFRWIVRIFVLFLTVSMTVLSVLGGLSAVQILNDPNNVQIPSGSLDFNLTSTEPYINVPFRITNAGYYDLTNLTISFKIEMDNATEVSQTIYDDTESFGDILHGETLDGNYNATNFITTDFYFDPTFLANITVSASYSLDLISFEVRLINLNVTEL